MARPDRAEEAVGLVGPVGRAIHRAAVAEQHPVGEARGLHVFEVALHVVDGRLQRLARVHLGRPGEAAGKQQGRRLGHHHHALANLPPEQIRRRRLAAARAAGQHDAAAIPPVASHPSIEPLLP